MGTQRVAAITGAGSGINREVANVLSPELAIAVCDLNGEAAQETADAIVAAGGVASAWALDVADREAVQATFGQIVAQHGSIDVLVNGAGYAQFVDFLDLGLDDWERMMAVNVTGTFSCTQAAVPSMKERGWGRVVNISSVGALTGSAKHCHYAAAKAAVIGFSNALCKEIGPWGITINCVAPGSVDTAFQAVISQEANKRFAQTPVGRIGQPSDIAAGVKYLASEDAGYVTGTVLHVNGGIYTTA